ncbi:MAG TPA: glycosyltransferase family 2 protein [Candidatus Magasanikbacteria bacterium]|nr:glycosyltransferase family 2 protein [Candidatus Magasanikbacteria bacterium]
MKDIAIIVVNYKMKAHIEKCLSSLFPEIASSNLQIEVVIVDNASGDSIEFFLKEKYPSVKCILLEENFGFGRAQNIGMQSVPAKYYFVLNPDTNFPSGGQTLEKMFRFMESHPNVGMAGPKLLNEDGTLQSSCWRFPTFFQPVLSRTILGQKGRGKKISDHYFMKDFDHNSTRPVDVVMGSAMFVRAEAIQQVGMFDEKFKMYFEDTDWCLRMWEKKWAVYYVHDSVLTHAHRRGSAEIPGIIRGFFRNKLARIHFISWLTYMWKWHRTYKYYVEKY